VCFALRGGVVGAVDIELFRNRGCGAKIKVSRDRVTWANFPKWKRLKMLTSAKLQLGNKVLSNCCTKY
jgi:hypothetical protein